MPKGAVRTDPDRRREAVNMPVAAVWAPDGDQHRARDRPGPGGR